MNKKELYDLSELALMVKYLEKGGAYHVMDICYYNEGSQITVNKTVFPGVISGVPVGYQWFFGNITVDTIYGGTIVLANENSIWIHLTTALPNLNEAGFIDIYQSIGQGLNLLGNGAYRGSRRLYNCAFNKIDFTHVDTGAATFTTNWNINGYLFKLR